MMFCRRFFIRLWNKRQSIVIHSSFRNYLYTIVQHCISDHQPEQQKEKGIPLLKKCLSIPKAGPLPMSSINTNRHFTSGRNATNKLPGQMRRIYSMKNEDQLSVKEIASELQLSEQTVKNQLHTAGQRILKMLKQVQIFF